MTKQATVTITLTSRDFNKLVETAMAWGKDWFKQKGRFSDAPLFTWKMAYWAGDDWLKVLHLQAYISACGYESQTVWDNAQASYLILTNYVADFWED